MADPSIKFSNADLETDINDPGNFDLTICVEVAEHLTAGRARRIVETLCSAADVIVFSAAIPLQGGTHHINEQFQSFWAQHFDACGYERCDYFRPRIWLRTDVEPWYRQNLLLYVRRSHPVLNNMRNASLVPGPLDIVHPEIFTGNVEYYKRALESPTLRLRAEMIVRWTRRQMSRALLRGDRGHS
jgi:hypothetical protein